MTPNVPDAWAAGAAYDVFMGRWSRQLAPRFVSWLALPADGHWLDVGCGTGALTNAICDLADPASVVGCDPAAPFVEYAREHARDGRAAFVVAGSGHLPSRDGGYDSVTSLLALNFLPEPEAAIREMQARAATSGAVSACVWDYADGMEFLRFFWDVATTLDATAAELDEGKRFPLCRPDALTDLFATSGLRDVRCDAIVIPTAFADFEDYWRPLLGGTGPVPSYVASLDVDRRATLARTLADTLRPRTRTTIALTARAWAVRGTVR